MLPAHPALAENLNVAVAANFARTMAEIAGGFETATGHSVKLIPGSTGKLYAQALNDAPFDLFLAADRERPERLEREGLAVPGTRFTYAIGRLVLWSPEPGLVDRRGDVLNGAGFRFLAIANPELAPYGRAAREALESLGYWDKLQPKLVRGENIGQAYRFVHSGNAQLGLVAASQLILDESRPNGSSWAVPAELHAPIEQQAVLLDDSPAGRELLSFIRDETALRTIESHGYLRPR